MPSGNKPLPKTILTQIYTAIWHHKAQNRASMWNFLFCWHAEKQASCRWLETPWRTCSVIAFWPCPLVKITIPRTCVHRRTTIHTPLKLQILNYYFFFSIKYATQQDITTLNNCVIWMITYASHSIEMFRKGYPSLIMTEKMLENI